MIFDYPDGELQSADRCDAGRKQQARARGVDRSVRTTLMAQPIVPLRPPLATRSNAGVQGRTDSTAIRILRCRTVAQGRLHQLNYIRDLPPQPWRMSQRACRGKPSHPMPRRRCWRPSGRVLPSAFTQVPWCREFPSGNWNWTSRLTSIRPRFGARAIPRRRPSGSRRSAFRFDWRRTRLARLLRHSCGTPRYGRRLRTRSIIPSTST
jgi:hypothetical protein